VAVFLKEGKNGNNFYQEKFGPSVPTIDNKRVTDYVCSARVFELPTRQ
jgi:hypothetical protein